MTDPIAADNLALSELDQIERERAAYARGVKDGIKKYAYYWKFEADRWSQVVGLYEYPLSLALADVDRELGLTDDVVKAEDMVE